MHQCNEQKCAQNQCANMNSRQTNSYYNNQMYANRQNCSCHKNHNHNMTIYDNDNMPIAMAYVPWQKFQNVYSIQDGCFFCGTIFKELDKPFLGRRR